MFSYSAYGLTIQSTLELPELLATSGAADVTIRAGLIEAPGSAPDSDDAGVFGDAEAMYLVIRTVGAIVIRRGIEIVYDLIPDADEDTLRMWLLDAALSVLLAQRGHLLLHASVVEFGGGAVAFLGNSGDGKSTMASALCARGGRLISDDILPVYSENGQPYTYPGAPRFKLWPDAVAGLGIDPTQLPRLQPDVEKRARRTVGATGKIQLTRLYVLKEGPQLKIAPQRSREAFVDLARYTYTGHWRKLAGAEVAHFRQCQWLASKVAVAHLERPRDFKLLAQVAALIEQDLFDNALIGSHNLDH